MIPLHTLLAQGAARVVPVVFHVGTLNPADTQPASHEGDGLSVSLCPDAWRRIARLGDAPLHRLTNSHGCFLDVYAFQINGTWMEQVWQWNLAQGFVQRGSYWTVSTPDYESGLDLITKWRDQRSAEAEAEGHDEVMVAEVDGFLPTAAMHKRMRGWNVPLVLTQEFALFLWAEACLPHVCGLWWDDTLCVASYSAPRGVIFPAYLDRWTHVQATTPGPQRPLRMVRLLLDDRDQHAEQCCCCACNDSGTSFGVSILDESQLAWVSDGDIDPLSLDDARIERVYGPDEAAAHAAAERVCVEQGWLVINPVLSD